MMQHPVYRSFAPQIQQRAPFMMQQQPLAALPGMQRSNMRGFRQDPSPLSPRQIAKMAGISVPLAIQPGAGLLGVTLNQQRKKRTTKKPKSSSKSQKRFFLPGITGPLIPQMRLNNPALARFAARDPPAIPLGPLMRSQPQIAAMTAPSFGGQERMANYPSILSPSLHSQSQPLSGYPVANMPSSNSPMVPPYFSAAAMPMKFSNAVPNAPVYAQQTPGISRQGIPFNQSPSSIMKNWFSSPMQQGLNGPQESAESGFQIPSGGPPVSMFGAGRATSEAPFRNLANYVPQFAQQSPSAMFPQGFGAKKSAVPKSGNVHAKPNPKH